jgi:hypothetical protein
MAGLLTGGDAFSIGSDTRTAIARYCDLRDRRCGPVALARLPFVPRGKVLWME